MKSWLIISLIISSIVFILLFGYGYHIGDSIEWNLKKTKQITLRIDSYNGYLFLSFLQIYII